MAAVSKEKKESIPGKRKSYSILAAVNVMLLMVLLGASDSLRGIFAPGFEQHFGLSAFQVSLIITVSYIGNLVFLCFGGKMLDEHDRKKVTLGVLAVWIGALLIYIFTDSYLFLLVGMFLAMGTSTLLNTTVNILTPLLFTASPGLMVNLFFFVQGIGTSTSQNLAGRFADSYGTFRIVNMLLVFFGMICFLLLIFVEIPGAGKSKSDKEIKKPVSYKHVISQNGFGMMVVIFGFYFIAEHGIMNWLVSYGKSGLGLDSSSASMYLSVFYGGMTIGRLLFAPVVHRIGVYKSITCFGGIGAVLFIAGILLGNRGLWILSLSGLAISVIYPTLVLMICYIYPKEMLATATGLVISIATLFDIGFNFAFGKMIDMAGYRVCFMILPVCMAGFYICYLIFLKRYRKEGRNE